MPNRVIKESICESESLSECSFFAQELYKRLITYADDYGRFNSDTAIMRARLFPREYETITEQDIIDALVELCGVGKISFYQPQVFNQRGKKGVYGVFPNWGDHQRLRESKAKCPEPYDTAINDWYLRRFIPLDMKVEILLRDGFKCQICGKFLTSCRDAERFVKLGSGLFHIDHIVPVANGGRATMENLRLTCPTCNLTRKRKFDFRGFIDESDSSGLRRVAADCGEVRPESESESNTESESEVEVRTREDATTSDDILSISPSEADAWRQDMAALEDAARGIGLPVQMHDLELLNTLRGDYGTEWVLQAIKRTQYRNRTWGVVCGILRSWKQNGGIDDGIGRKPGGNDPQAGRAGRSYNLRDEIL